MSYRSVTWPAQARRGAGGEL